jgi:hypothetical protein
LPGVDPSMKAETLFLLQEAPLPYRAPVLFDGERNATPVAFIVHT